MIDAQKHALRRDMAVRRASAADRAPNASETLAPKARDLIARSGVSAPVIAGYMRLRTEIDPAPLLGACERLGARIALPITPRGAERGLTFRQWRPGDLLVVGAFGVREPEETAPSLEPDIVIVPMLAFDRAGRRLGYGKGYYDRTLAELRARKPILAVGLAYAAQEVARVPTDDHDAPLDFVLTESDWIVPAVQS